MPSPESDRPIDPHDFDPDWATVLPNRADARDSLLPPFEDYCLRLGGETQPTPQDVEHVELFRDCARSLFSRVCQKSSMLTIHNLATRVVEEWEGGTRSLIIAAEFCALDTGQSLFPIALAFDDDNPISGPGFWKSPDEEPFNAPVGVIAKLNVGRTLHADFDPILPPKAASEALQHAQFVAAQIAGDQRRHPGNFINTLESGSLMVSLLLWKIQKSHQLGDPEIKVEDELELGDVARDHLRSAPILGINELVINKKPRTHEVSVIAMDTRPHLFDLSPQGIILPPKEQSIPVFVKRYTLTLEPDGHFLGDPVVISLKMGPLKRSA